MLYRIEFYKARDRLVDELKALDPNGKPCNNEAVKAVEQYICGHYLHDMRIAIYERNSADVIEFGEMIADVLRAN